MYSFWSLANLRPLFGKLPVYLILVMRAPCMSDLLDSFLGRLAARKIRFWEALVRKVKLVEAMICGSTAKIP
jgi:hypothetical protein